MELGRNILVGLGLAVCLSINFVSVPDADAAEVMTCQEMQAERRSRHMKIMTECDTDPFVQAAKTEDHIHCVLRCSMIREGMISSTTGKFDMDKINEKFVTRQVPENLEPLRVKAMAILKDCKEAHDSELDINDPTCASYGELIPCLVEMMHLCED